jgi:transcriptional regulator with XRE-family HTH domain
MGKEKGPQAAEAGRLLGQNLLRFRQRAGLSQQGTADRAGLHRTHVALIEAENRLPRLDTIVKLAGALEVQPCALLIGMAWKLDPPEEEGTVGRDGEFTITLVELHGDRRWSLYPHLEVFGEGVRALRRGIDAPGSLTFSDR